MSINLIANEKELKESFEKVANSTTGQQWTIFEYENNNSSIIKVGEYGEIGGLKDLIQSLDPSKIQYGFGSIECPGIKQRKVVLIHWQGSCIPVTRLANTASHLNFVKDFVKKVNLTIYARTEEDIDLDNINSEFNKLISNNNNIQSSTMFEVPSPVKPHNDIDLQEREKFWRQQQEEEHERRKDEMKKNEEKAKLFQLERKQLDSELHQKHVNELAAKQKQQPVIPLTSQQKKGALVTGRTQMFEQRVQELADSRPVVKPKNFKYEVAITKPLGTPVNKQDNDEKPIDSPSLKASELAKQFNGGPISPPVVVKTPLVDCPPPPPIMSKPPSTGLTVVALWDYQAQENNEISFNPNDVITEVEKIHDGWWKGKTPDGQVGLFPSNFVKES